MKQKLQNTLNTAKQYLPMMIANIVFALVFCVLMWGSERNEGYISSTQLLIVLLLPLYFAFHGIMSYILTKRIWIPHLIFFVSTWIFLPLSSFDFRFHLLFTIEWLFWPVISSLISVLPAFLTMVFYKLLAVKK